MFTLCIIVASKDV